MVWYILKPWRNRWQLIVHFSGLDFIFWASEAAVAGSWNGYPHQERLIFGVFDCRLDVIHHSQYHGWDWRCLCVETEHRPRPPLVLFSPCFLTWLFWDMLEPSLRGWLQSEGGLTRECAVPRVDHSARGWLVGHSDYLEGEFWEDKVEYLLFLDISSSLWVKWPLYCHKVHRKMSLELGNIKVLLEEHKIKHQ